MKSKRIIDVETRVLPDGGASCSWRENHLVPTESKKTAAAKIILALNAYCERHRLGFFVDARDEQTGQLLRISFTGSDGKRYIA